MKKCKVCTFLASGIEFRYNAISLCNRVSHVGGGDIVVDFYDENNNKKFIFDVRSYLRKRNEVIYKNQTNEIYPKCIGCMELSRLKEINIKDLKISDIVLHHWTKCNSNCIYCYTSSDKHYFNIRKSYKFLPILKSLISRNLLEYGGTVNWAGGEISCLDEFESILAILDRYDFFSIFNSSCVKFESSIASHLKSEKGVLVVSLDCGSKETHKKIKQVDTYEQVWENISKYIDIAHNKNSVNLKYIILPGVNDNKLEILEFLRKASFVGIKQVIFDIDIYYLNENRNNIKKYIVDLFYYALEQCIEFGISFLLYPNSRMIFSDGKYENKKMLEYVFGESRFDTSRRNIPLYSIDKAGNITKYFSIQHASKLEKIKYGKVLKMCDLSSHNKFVFVNGKTYIYCKNIDQKGRINSDKVKEILASRKLYFYNL